jgi:hypothetical protein
VLKRSPTDEALGRDGAPPVRHRCHGHCVACSGGGAPRLQVPGAGLSVIERHRAGIVHVMVEPDRDVPLIRVQPIPCPKSGDITEVRVNVAVMATRGFTFDCPSCGGHHTLITDTFGRIGLDTALGDC